MQTVVERMEVVVAEQMKTVQERYPLATLEPLSHGRHLVLVPDFTLPEGWSVENSDATKVCVMFVLPAGFPATVPESFWTRENCLAPGGRWPHYTNRVNTILRYDGVTGTWFGWKLQAWNPNRDTIWTYLAVIKSRFNRNK